jgi:hypothetical protein
MILNLRDYGAVGDGVTINDAAIIAWIADGLNHAGSSSAHGGSTLYAPAGIYLVRQSGLFSPSIRRFGLKFIGDGRFSSIFRLAPNLEEETWFFDNVEGESISGVTWQALGFHGCVPLNDDQLSSIPDQANFFRCTSTGVEQDYTFIDTAVQYFNNVEQWRGTNSASEVKRLACEYVYNKGILHDNANQQSLNHDYTDCNIIHRGPSFLFHSLASGNYGAGSVRVSGGNIVLLPVDQPTYFWDVQAGNQPGATPSLLSGVRMEFRNNNHKLYRNAPGHPGDLLIDASMIELQDPDGGEISTDWARIDRDGVLKLRDTEIYQLPVIPQVKLIYNGFGENQPGLFEAQGCALTQEFVDTIDVGSQGRAIGTDLRPAKRAGSGDPYPVTALDFALGSPTLGNARRFPSTFELFTPPNRGWPGGLGNVVTSEEIPCRFAIKTVIDEIHIERAAFGTDTTVVSYVVGSNDKATIYATTPAAPFNQAISFHARDLGIILSDANRANVRVWASVATQQRATGGSIRIQTRG